MAQQKKFNFNYSFQGPEFVNVISTFYYIFYTVFYFRKPFYAPCDSFSASCAARRRRSGGNRMALGTPEMRRQAQVARNRRVEERENEEPVPVHPGTPRLRLISDSD